MENKDDDDDPARCGSPKEPQFTLSNSTAITESHSQLQSLNVAGKYNR